jgi:hypothetical protein
MIDELKNRRKLSYLMNIWDDVNLPHKINYDNISEQVINFFNTESQLIYPAKSYFVAIVYAKCIEKWFNIPFYDSLNDIELLPDDKWFVPYYKDKKTYDEIICNINEIWEYSSINKTVDYFKKEFLINGDIVCNTNI